MNMHHRLTKFYLAVVAPALAGFFALGLLRPIDPPMTLPAQIRTYVSSAIFVLTAVFALAGPILYRSIFAHAHRQLHQVPQAELFAFERNLTGMALVTPYLALMAYFLQLPRFYLAASLLMALYAVYYYYPSQKRLAFDEKIFRTRHEMPVKGRPLHD